MLPGSLKRRRVEELAPLNHNSLKCLPWRDLDDELVTTAIFQENANAASPITKLVHAVEGGVVVVSIGTWKQSAAELDVVAREGWVDIAGSSRRWSWRVVVLLY